MEEKNLRKSLSFRDASTWGRTKCEIVFSYPQDVPFMKSIVPRFTFTAKVRKLIYEVSYHIGQNTPILKDGVPSQNLCHSLPALLCNLILAQTVYG